MRKRGQEQELTKYGHERRGNTRHREHRSDTNIGAQETFLIIITAKEICAVLAVLAVLRNIFCTNRDTILGNTVARYSFRIGNSC